MADQDCDLRCGDYAAMTQLWKQDLERLGWVRTWSPDVEGPAYCESVDSCAMSLYDAWTAATGTPKDFNLGK